MQSRLQIPEDKLSSIWLPRKRTNQLPVMDIMVSVLTHLLTRANSQVPYECHRTEHCSLSTSMCCCRKYVICHIGLIGLPFFTLNLAGSFQLYIPLQFPITNLQFTVNSLFLLQIYLPENCDIFIFLLMHVQTLLLLLALQQSISLTTFG